MMHGYGCINVLMVWHALIKEIILALLELRQVLTLRNSTIYEAMLFNEGLLSLFLSSNITSSSDFFKHFKCLMQENGDLCIRAQLRIAQRDRQSVKDKKKLNKRKNSPQPEASLYVISTIHNHKFRQFCKTWGQSCALGQNCS